jgi:hypothetical protein
MKQGDNDMAANDVESPFRVKQVAHEILCKMIQFKGEAYKERSRHPYAVQYILECTIEVLKEFKNLNDQTDTVKDAVRRWQRKQNETIKNLNAKFPGKQALISKRDRHDMEDLAVIMRELVTRHNYLHTPFWQIDELIKDLEDRV